MGHCVVAVARRGQCPMGENEIMERNKQAIKEERGRCEGLIARSGVDSPTTDVLDV